MEKRNINLLFVIVAIVAIVAVGFALNSFSNSTTGQATLTPGANYGPIQTTSNRVECNYLTENDGWDVTVKGEIKFYDKVAGISRTLADHCESPRTVVEYHCTTNYKQERVVNCPTGMRCSDGACI